MSPNTSKLRGDRGSWGTRTSCVIRAVLQGTGLGEPIVDGRSISWTVSGANPERIDLVIDRAAMMDLVIVKDTIVLYMSN